MTTFTPEQAAKIKELYSKVVEAETAAADQAKEARITAVTEALSVVSTLTRMERVFLIHYLAGETKTEAARIAGYGTPEKQGSRLSKNPKIKAAIEEYFHEQEMGARELIARMSQQARNEASQYILANGTVDLQAIIQDGKQHLIKGTRYDARGNLIVEFVPAFESQVKIGELHGIWKQSTKVEDWRDEIVAMLRDGRISAEDVQQAFPVLAGELLARAGLTG